MVNEIREGVLPFGHGGGEINVSFPDSGNASKHIYNILSGQDYPILNCHFKPDCIIDIGANIGATALFFTKVYPGVDCFCYEPSPSTFTYLEKNTNQVPEIKVFNYGLSNELRTVKLYTGTSQCLQNSLHPSIEVTNEFEFAQIQPASAELEEILNGKRALVKIDTEGCEVPILEDLENLLKHIDILYLEYHSEEDRRTIDRVLSDHFSLCHSMASIVHRGNMMFLSQRLLSEFPQWETLAIRRQ